MRASASKLRRARCSAAESGSDGDGWPAMQPADTANPAAATQRAKSRRPVFAGGVTEASKGVCMLNAVSTVRAGVSAVKSYRGYRRARVAEAMRTLRKNCRIATS